MISHKLLRLILPVFLMVDGDKALPSRQELEAWGANQIVGKYKGIAEIVDPVCRYLEDRNLLEQTH